jgi:hypothetical protein
MMIDNDSSSISSDSDNDYFRIDFEPNSKPYSNEIDQDVDEKSEKISAIGSCPIMYFNVFGFESYAMLDTGAALSIIHRSVVDQMKKKISLQDWKMIKFSNKSLPEVYGVEGSGIKVLFSMTIPISREFRKTEWAKIFVVEIKMRTKIIFGVATMKKLARTDDRVPLSYDFDAIPQEKQAKFEFPEEQEEKRLNTVAVDLFDSRRREHGIKADVKNRCCYIAVTNT